MKRVMIVCRSQTEALRCSRLLEGTGVSNVLRKPPREKQDGPCSWGVRIYAEDREKVERRMLEKNFYPARVYAYDDPGEWGGGK